MCNSGAAHNNHKNTFTTCTIYSERPHFYVSRAHLSSSPSARFGTGAIFVHSRLCLYNTNLNGGVESLLRCTRRIGGLHDQRVGTARLTVKLATRDDRSVAGVDVEGAVLVAGDDAVLDASVVTCVGLERVGGNVRSENIVYIVNCVSECSSFFLLRVYVSASVCVHLKFEH